MYYIYYCTITTSTGETTSNDEILKLKKEKNQSPKIMSFKTISFKISSFPENATKELIYNSFIVLYLYTNIFIIHRTF